MANLKFSALTTAPDLSEADFIAGIRLNEDATYSNYKYTAAQVIAWAVDQTRKAITIAEDTTEITDNWIDGKVVQLIITGGQAFMLDVDFTQSGDTLTAVGGLTFTTAQKVVLML